MDPSGKAISVPKTDPVWSAITKGWSWHVVASSVEEAMPRLTLATSWVKRSKMSARVWNFCWSGANFSFFVRNKMARTQNFP